MHKCWPPLAVPAILAILICTSSNAHATETSAMLSTNAATEVELKPGESVLFQKGDIASIELIQDKQESHKQLRTTRSATAPNCIVVQVEKMFIQVYNNCGGTEPQRIKVALAFAPDTECKSVQPGTRTNVGPALGRIDGVYLC
ncbi:Uncharacterised protein [Corynebacterium renale]|uniref:Secreted protein n=1 Tax=Corynebacterium renale TaxID=1724 RepID=A0A2A9DNT0_9CORY|nr:hypothetical protein ATK06_1124 [Corynebacterium renale]SQG65372.1 Uncharacterised protein [Corynebacterium renale]SQI21165.1 Uncharacterised protein [Corynebacterium renale]STC99032.1 Uncharacterised protein [Corynebacterium renale]